MRHIHIEVDRGATTAMDTLFKRLFALMWLALVVSHAVAFLVVARNMPGADGWLPTFPSLPPVSFAHGDATPRISQRPPDRHAGTVEVRATAHVLNEMDDLIESALEVLRGASSYEEPGEATDVHALMQALVDDLTDLGQPVSLRGEPAPAHVQSAALRRVVSNLVNNALRYGKRAEVSVHPHGNAIHIVIEDEGPGIPEAQLDAAMKPFYRIESSRNRLTVGSAPGLYVARVALAADRADQVLAALRGRQHDHPQVGRLRPLAQRGADRQAVAIGQHHVRHHDVDAALRQARTHLRGAGRGDCLEAEAPQAVADGFQQFGIVVDNEAAVGGQGVRWKPRHGLPPVSWVRQQRYDRAS
jgi:hypothetical protein